MTYDIAGFWMQSLRGLLRPPSHPSLPGWSIEAAPNTSFVEADLNLRDGYNHLGTPIWFVAAPGAVGKSTLAKAISAHTGAVYLDLAKAETVAGNYLTGGLVKNRLLDACEANQSTLLIDALDEARLRVTQSSFEDFLKDAETLVRGRTLPAVFASVSLMKPGYSWRMLDCPVRFSTSISSTENGQSSSLWRYLTARPANQNTARLQQV
jgi:hypothetical protein